MKRTTLNAIIAIILAVAIVITCGVGSSWFTNGDIRTWFNSWGQKVPEPDEDNPPAPEEKKENVTAVISDIKCSGVELKSALLPKAAYASEGVSEQAETAYILNATVTPAEADGTLNWTVEWSNAASTWASGKTVTDYVTVTASAGSTGSATVACLQPFGESIVVKAISVQNVSAYASCSVEYLKTLQSVVFKVQHDNNSVYDLTLDSTKTNQTATWRWQELKNVYTAPDLWDDYTNVYQDNFTDAYTIEDTVVSQKIMVSASPALKTELAKINMGSMAHENSLGTYTFIDGLRTPDEYCFLILTQRALFGSYEYVKYGLFSFVCGTYDNDGDYDYYYGSEYAKLITALKACSVDLLITLTVELETSGTYTFDFNVNIDDSNLSVVANSVAMDKSQLVFGGRSQ